jgi:thioredoxin 1
MNNMRRTTGLCGVLLLAVAIIGTIGVKSVGARATQTGVPDAPEKGKVFKTRSLEVDFSPFKVVFLELGSDRCIPCRQMQPIMKDIAAAFPDDVLVVFYDVWEDPAPARKYKVQLIPTQIFLDGAGKELFRHMGLYPKDEILKILEKQGLKPKGS